MYSIIVACTYDTYSRVVSYLLYALHTTCDAKVFVFGHANDNNNKVTFFFFFFFLFSSRQQSLKVSNHGEAEKPDSNFPICAVRTVPCQKST